MHLSPLTISCTGKVTAQFCMATIACLFLLPMLLQELEKSKPVILTGDLNCGHEEIDIFNPAVSNLDFTCERVPLMLYG